MEYAEGKVQINQSFLEFFNIHDGYVNGILSRIKKHNLNDSNLIGMTDRV